MLSFFASLPSSSDEVLDLDSVGIIGREDEIADLQNCFTRMTESIDADEDNYLLEALDKAGF